MFGADLRTWQTKGQLSRQHPSLDTTRGMRADETQPGSLTLSQPRACVNEHARAQQNNHRTQKLICRIKATMAKIPPRARRLIMSGGRRRRVRRVVNARPKWQLESERESCCSQRGVTFSFNFGPRRTMRTETWTELEKFRHSGPGYQLKWNVDQSRKRRRKVSVPGG
jgi:hypothetical protein